MIPERWKEVERLYQAALDHPPDQRAAFLADACKGDAELLHSVDALLAQQTLSWDQTATFAEQPPPRPLGPGTQLGPYRIEGSLGAGGMGEVFRAVDTRLHRTVALKFLPRQRMTDPELRRRFLQEARAASALNHPHIVTVHDISNQNGVDFLVMEYVAGKTLRDLIRSDELTFEQVAHLGEQIARALDAAHTAGIVHRDIKPANVMVTAARQVKVLDFGIAKMTMPAFSGEGDTRTLLEDTATGVVMGTISYMSPEQARGEKVDHRSDIFSLGCVLFEAATGQLPFAGANPLAILQAIANDAAASPSSLRAGLPGGFDELIAHCLNKQPEQRPSSAELVADSLKRLLHPPEPATRPADGRRSIAVVPFQFRNAASEDQFLSVALADAVANRLGAAPKLLVRPTANVMKYAGKDVEWTQVARELNVDLVVEGSIQKMGPRVRVLVQVNSAGDAKTLHSAKYDGAMDDLFGLQDRLADSVFEVFVPRAAKEVEHLTAPPARHPLAFELYLRAIDRIAHFNKFEIGAAIEMLERAIALDPTFADAWGLLAHARTQMGMHLDPDPKWFELAEQAIARTLELDPVHFDAFCTRGMILWSPSRGFQHRAALRAFNAAVKINPGRYGGHLFRASVLFHLGFHEDAARDVEEALLTNPGYALSHASQAYIALYQADYGKSAEYNQRALTLDPALVHANILSPLAFLWTGQLGKAREKLDKARQMVPEEPQIIAMEGLILAHEGDFQRAEELADQASAMKRSLTHSHHSWHIAAGVYALCGQPEKAVAELRRCAQGGLPNPRAFMNDPHFRGLHGNPEFTELMSSLRRDFDAFREEFALETGTSGSC